MISYDPAYNNTASCISRITYTTATPAFCGIADIHRELAEKSTYLERRICASRELPTAAQLRDWHQNVTHHRSFTKASRSSGRVSLRRAPDGDAGFSDSGAIDFLSRREGRV